MTVSIKLFTFILYYHSIFRLFVQTARVFVWQGSAGSNNLSGEVEELAVPEPMCSEFERHDKDEAVAAHVSRFSKSKTFESV